MSSNASPPLRRLLLDAAREILREPDTRLDLRKVAERAGKSRTAPYVAFGKEREGGGIVALRMAVAGDGAEELSRRMESAAESSSDPLEAFQTVAREVLTFAGENPRLFRLMYGAGTRALTAAGGAAVHDHPEFQHFREERERADDVLRGLLARGRERGLLPGGTETDEEVGGQASGGAVETAWATLVGVAALGQDEFVRGTDEGLDASRGARRVTEAVFGVDPGLVEEAWRSLRQAGGTGVPARPSSRPSGTAPAPPPARAASTSPGQEPPRQGGDWLPGLLKDLVPLNNPTVAAREILRRLDLGGGESAASEARSSPGAAGADGPPEPAEAPEAESASVFPTGPSLSAVLRSHSGLRRAVQEARRLQGAPVLWVDDHPEEREAEAQLLRTLGLHLVRALDVEEAFRRIDRQKSSVLGPFRAILCDLSRGSRWRPGTETVYRLSREAPDTPILVYDPESDRAIGMPKGATGITDSPDELLHLLLDALGRAPSAPASS